MTAAATEKPRETKNPRAGGPGRGPKIDGGSLDARRFAVMILDVLAGARTPAEAAKGLGCSLPRYYVMENRALLGLVEACEHRPRKGRNTPEKQMESLQRQVKKLERELARKQALTRLAQRAVGLSAAEPKKPERGRRRRKPVIRALKMARALVSEPVGKAEAPPPLAKTRQPKETEGEEHGAQADGS